MQYNSSAITASSIYSSLLKGRYLSGLNTGCTHV